MSEEKPNISALISPKQDMGAFKFDKEMLVANCAMTLMAALATGYSATKIRSTFNLRRAPYLILYIDAVVAFVCCSVSLVTLIIFIYDVEWAQNRVGCNFYSLGNFIACTFGPFTCFLISAIR